MGARALLRYRMDTIEGRNKIYSACHQIIIIINNIPPIRVRRILLVTFGKSMFNFFWKPVALNTSRSLTKIIWSCNYNRVPTIRRRTCNTKLQLFCTSNWVCCLTNAYICWSVKWKLYSFNIIRIQCFKRIRIHRRRLLYSLNKFTSACTSRAG